MAQGKARAGARIRNMGIMAHIDAGKTTLTERLLFITGRIHRMGEVHEGAATMDWMPQEQERGITITSAVTTFEWKGCDVHLIDTPGHVDFTIEVERSLRVLDGVITVLDGVAGVEPQTETVWRQADKFGVPRFVFINKLDRMGASFDRCLTSLRNHFGHSRVILPLQIPIGEESAHRGCVDLIRMKAMTWEGDDPAATTEGEVPEALAGQAVEARNRMVELLADLDDGIAQKYLDGMPVDESIRGVIRRETIAGRCIPVLCGSALRNKGIPPVLDAIVHYFPSPDDVGIVRGTDPKTLQEVTRPLLPSEPLATLAFKVQIMEDGRRMTYVRVYSGRMKVGDSTLNVSRNIEEKISRIFLMHANQRQRVDHVECGNIVGVLGLKKTSTGDTLTDPDHPILLEPISGKDPVIYQAVEPMTSADKEKLDQTLDRLAEEDPTFRSYEDKETGERLMCGMGELHLEILADRLNRQFGLETRVGKPQVVYRETITANASATAVFDRVHEDKRLFGKVTVRVEPLERGAGIRFDNRCSAPFFVGEFLDAAKEGALEAAKSGPVEGHSMDDLLVIIEEAGFVDGVSAPIGYRIAASEAAARACRSANPRKMEPVMRVEITVPEEYVGAAISSINERKGKVERMAEQAGYRVVRAEVSLRSMFGYSKDIRTRTQGRGTFSMEFSHYDIML
jgi:elongation factor G